MHLSKFPLVLSFLVFVLVSCTQSPVAGDPGPTIPVASAPEAPAANPVPPPATPPNHAGTVTLQLDFKYGSAGAGTGGNIYVAWIDNGPAGFIQNLTICQKLITGGVSGVALPYWQLNEKAKSDSTEISAVTGATKASQDFSVSAVLKNTAIRQFRVCFEVDRSWEVNDWFYNAANTLVDQPALLYTAQVNLDDATDSYALQFTGWTPNGSTENIITDTPSGTLQTELQYITKLKSGSGFGLDDSRAATRMVKSITLTLK